MSASHLPSRFSSLVFRAKAGGLQLRRAAFDWHGGIKRHAQTSNANFPFVLATSRTPLWDDLAGIESALQQGKVQNLRAAARRLNGVLVRADDTFSFWKQVGRATRKRGFVAGRLLREGCLMPAVGGGLCQLSNALYDVALLADCELLERHAHSRIIAGSTAQRGRDATVAWNYVDLRFRARYDFLLEVSLSSNELLVQLRGAAPPSRVLATPIPLLEARKARRLLDPLAHSCDSCAQTRCAHHAPQLRAARREKTAFLLDEIWPEFKEYVAQLRDDNDELYLPWNGAQWRNLASTRGAARAHFATTLAWRRALLARHFQHRGAARLAAQLESTAAIARHLTRAVPPEAMRLVIAQSLLPFAWDEGAGGGRTFQVLLTRLPLHVLHERLDAALTRHPERATLREFRAPQRVVESERQALRDAERIITPHLALADLFPDQSLRLQWNVPRAVSGARFSEKIVAFPGPTAARKGAYELREAARELDLEILLLGAELEGEDFWRGVRARRALPGENWLHRVAAVVQPSLIEEHPRPLLRALACGVPVIATPQCGLDETPQVALVPAENASALRDKLAEIVFGSQRQ